MITAMDFSIATTLAKIAELQVMDDTIIIFSSDVSARAHFLHKKQ